MWYAVSKEGVVFVQWGEKFKGYELWFNKFKLFENLEFITNTKLCWGFQDAEHEVYAFQVRRLEDKVEEITRPFLTCYNSVVCNTDNKSRLKMIRINESVCEMQYPLVK